MSDRLDDLDPETARKAEALIEAMRVRGFLVVVVHTLRTDAEQDALYAKGRTRPGEIVTNAKAGQTWHNALGAIGKARAFDVAFLHRGRRCWCEHHPWRDLGAAGEALGLTWGGRFRGFGQLGDAGHFEDRRGERRATLRRQYVAALKGATHVA